MAAGHAVDRNCRYPRPPGSYCTNHDDGIAVDIYGINGYYLGKKYNKRGILSDSESRGIPNDGSSTSEWSKNEAEFMREAEALQDWAINNREDLKLRQLFGPVDDKQFVNCTQNPTSQSPATNWSHENHPHFTVKPGGC